MYTIYRMYDLKISCVQVKGDTHKQQLKCVHNLVIAHKCAHYTVKKSVILRYLWVLPIMTLMFQSLSLWEVPFHKKVLRVLKLPSQFINVKQWLQLRLVLNVAVQVVSVQAGYLPKISIASCTVEVLNKLLQNCIFAQLI